MVLSNLKIGLEDRVKGFGNNIKKKIVVGVLSAGLIFSPYGCGDSNVEYMTPVSAQAIVYQCSDGVDNDNDTMTDFNDIGCYINGLYDPNRDSELQVQIYECSDKVDNDSDGVVDLDDAVAWSPVKPNYALSVALDEFLNLWYTDRYATSFIFE